MRRSAAVLALPVLAAVPLAAAGCGSSGGSSSGDAAAATPASQPATTTATAAAKHRGAVVALRGTDLGKVLVDRRGRTLYLFEKDTGRRSTCSGACAKVWPPLTTKGKAVARTGAKRSLLGTTKRSGGVRQVTYAGHPLYTYVGDHAPGDTNGNDLDQFGAEWYALTASGGKPSDDSGAKDEGADDSAPSVPHY